MFIIVLEKSGCVPILFILDPSRYVAPLRHISFGLLSALAKTTFLFGDYPSASEEEWEKIPNSELSVLHVQLLSLYIKNKGNTETSETGTVTRFKTPIVVVLASDLLNLHEKCKLLPWKSELICCPAQSFPHTPPPLVPPSWHYFIILCHLVLPTTLRYVLSQPHILEN